MMNPIPPSELFAMVAAGMPTDLTLGLGVQTLNGLRNWTVNVPRHHRVDAKFAEVLELLGELRADGALGFRFDTGTGLRTAYLLLEDREGRPLDPRARRLIELLGLDPDLRSFPIRFGFSEGRAGEIRIYTRSFIEILGNLAAQVEVPPDDVAAGRTYATQPSPSELPALPDLAVTSRADRPWDAGRPRRFVRRRGVSGLLVLDRQPRFRLKTRVHRSDAAVEPGRQGQRGAAAGA